jgi:hypothetical protein
MSAAGRVGWHNPSQGAGRAVRVERWASRLFYATPCRFFIDVPLDMSGCVAAARREALAAGYRLPLLGDVLATDALYRGAILVEIEPGGPESTHVMELDGEVLARELPEKGARLRVELDELVRWSFDLGHEVSAVYVQYQSIGDIPGAVRAAHVFAAIKGGERITEPPPPAR